jgi:hypothetical protein
LGQQPNIELTDAERPRHVLETAPARRWRPTKPGLVTSPEEKPIGGTFGTVGPDPGWAWRVIGEFELPSNDPDLRAVVGALAMARAAAAGRGAIREDIEVALALCGYWEDAPHQVVERRKRWLAAVPHDRRPGQTAVAEVDVDLLLKQPEQVHYLLTHGQGSHPDRSAN